MRRVAVLASHCTSGRGGRPHAAAAVHACTTAASEPPSKRHQTGAAAQPLGTAVAARAIFRYQTEVPGKAVGRYINTADDGVLADVLEEHSVDVGSARDLRPPPTIDSRCFELRCKPTAVKDFADNDEIQRVYYQEIEELVKDTTGAEHVIVFDHTVRDTGATSPNSKMGEAAGVVTRVHSDYTDRSGPERVKTLAQSGGYTGVKLLEEEREDILARRFCIVNVWRSIAEVPVQRMPLAVMEPSSLNRDDMVPYEMRFPDRTGENYGLKYSPGHRWYFFPRMVKDECLVFKTWESRKDRPRYCFHTAFKDLDEPADAPPRRSIEVRAVAIMPREK